jgi:hypothetical protein
MSHEGRCRVAIIGAAGHTIISWAVAVSGRLVWQGVLGGRLLPLCCCFAYVGGSLAGLGVKALWLVRGDLGDGCTGSSFAGSVKADLKRGAYESLAKRIQWAGDRGRARATKTLVGQFCEHAVRIYARLSALSEAEEA